MDGGREGGGDGGGEEGEEGGGGGGGRQSPREDTPPAPCSAFCGPRSCSTLPPSLSQQQGASSSSSPGGGDSGKRRRLWGLRGLVKMFRRRVRRRAGESSASPQPPQPTLRARSTSELAVDAHGGNNGPYNQGLSVSHDSVFTPDTTTDHHHHGHHTTPPALAIATRGVNMAELKAALRHRRGDDSGSGDDDPGLPRSPPTSPTTLDVLNHGLKASSRATQSTCSDGSLLSMGSSENDEDSLGAGSHHSSKVSLLEGRHQVVDDKPPVEEVIIRKRHVRKRSLSRNSYVSDSIIDGRIPCLDDQKKDHEPVAGAVPLSHQAAFHKIAVRPRRTHGVPRSRRATQIGLPDVIEEANSRNLSSLKLLTAAPTSTTHTAAPNSAPPHTQADGNVEERQKKEVEEGEKKEREEKREEPLFQRLFGSSSSSSNSKRAGRQASRGRGEDSRENSVSPLRRSGDQRASRDGKKRDSSGSRFPGVAVSKPRQDQSHPLPPSGRPRELSRERGIGGIAITPQEVTSIPDVSSASLSTSLPEATMRTSHSDDHHAPRPVSYPARPVTTAVRKVKSFRDVAPSHGREPKRPRAPSQADSETDESPVKPNQSSRLSASLENIEGGDGAKRQQPQPSPINKPQFQQEIPPASPQRSSTESLATTPLPGVFIRPHPTTRSPLFIQTPQADSTFNQDANSGPFSLDSSVGSAQSPGRTEVELRKAASVDLIGGGVELAPVHRRPRQQVPHDAKPTSDFMSVKVENVKAERKVELITADKKVDLGKEDKKEFNVTEKRENVKVERRESVKSEKKENVKSERRESMKVERHESMKTERREIKTERRESVKTERRESIKLERVEGVAGDMRRSSGQMLRSTSQTRSEDAEPKIETEDGGEPEPGAQAYRRQLRKEPSIKRAAPPRDSGTAVPEFMRIQLNRVESKGQAVIYDTEKERCGSKREEPIQSTILTSASVAQPVASKEGQETVPEDEKNEEQSHNPASTRASVQLTKKSSFQGPRSLMRDGSVSGVVSEGESVEPSATEPQSERVQLRKPLMAEKVITNGGSGDQTPPPPPPSSSRDQPELFKVFARRSFKVKDADKDKLELPDSEDDGLVDENGEVLEGTVTPIKPPVTPQPPVSPSPQESMQKPSINAISFNRKSVGNPALSFVPPAAAVGPGSPLGSKGVVIVSSTAASTTATTEVTPTPANVRTNTTVTTSSANIIQDTPRRPGRTSSPNIFATSSENPTTTSSGEVVSRIINRRLSEITSAIDGETPAQVRTSQPSPAHSKPSFNSRPSPSIIWPPRTQHEPPKEKEFDAQQNIITIGEKEVEKEEVMVSPFDIGAARRRFMKSVSVPSGGSTAYINDVSSGSSTREGQEFTSHSPVSVTTTPPPPPSSTTTISSGISSSILSRATPATTAAPTTPQFTVTVRTQPPPTHPPPASTPPPLTTHQPPTTTLPEPSTSPQPTTSPSTEQSNTAKGNEGGAEDWRVLVRQRREGRLKQSKTTEAEEIIIETTRPAVSRNSKVLEMASNFQKLQVA